MKITKDDLAPYILYFYAGVPFYWAINTLEMNRPISDILSHLGILIVIGASSFILVDCFRRMHDSIIYMGRDLEYLRSEIAYYRGESELIKNDFQIEDQDVSELEAKPHQVNISDICSLTAKSCEFYDAKDNNCYYGKEGFESWESHQCKKDEND